MKKIINTFLCAFLMLTTLIANPLTAKAEGIGYDVSVKTTYRGIVAYNGKESWTAPYIEFGTGEKEHYMYVEFSGSFESPEKDLMDRLNGTGYVEVTLVEKKNEEGKLIAKYNVKAIKEGKILFQFGDNLEEDIVTYEPSLHMNIEATKWGSVDYEETGRYDETDRELELEVGKGYLGFMDCQVDDSMPDVIIKRLNDSGFLDASLSLRGKGDGLWWRPSWGWSFSFVPLREGECTIDLGYGNSWHIVAKNKSGIKIQKLEVTGEDGFYAGLEDDRLILTKDKKYTLNVEATGDVENLYNAESSYSIESMLFSSLTDFVPHIVKNVDRRLENGTLFVTAELIGDTVGYYDLCDAFGPKWFHLSVQEEGCDPNDLYAIKRFGLVNGDVNSWMSRNKYWIENGKRQGSPGDPKNIFDQGYGNTERGREIYDPESDGWYWLDCIYDGRAAYGKEVWMPYVYQNENSMSDAEKRENANNVDKGMEEYIYQCMINHSGKWVRYDEEGSMMKGWVKIDGYGLSTVFIGQEGNTYYYDTKTGAMAKGYIMIDGVMYHFDEVTGVLLD